MSQNRIEKHKAESLITHQSKDHDTIQLVAKTKVVISEQTENCRRSPLTLFINTGS